VHPLPELTDPNFEALAAESVRRRLDAHGPVPWSICEARLGEDDYRRLCQWAERVTAATERRERQRRISAAGVRR
jgi:hypothetical protein